MADPIFTFTYTNHRGETAERRVRLMAMHFGSTEWHPEPQWLMRAFDIDKQAERDFAMNDVSSASALRSAYARGKRDGLEQAAGIADKWETYYPASIFPENGKSIDCISAGMGRHVAAKVAEEIREEAAASIRRSAEDA